MSWLKKCTGEKKSTCIEPMKTMTKLKRRRPLVEAGNVSLSFSAIVFLFVAASPIAHGNEDGDTIPACSICGYDDTDNYIPITEPDNEVYVPSIGRWTPCSQVEYLTKTLLKETDDDCRLLQAFGGICGCPVRDDACHLCGGNGSGLSVGFRYHTIEEDYPYNPLADDDYNMQCAMLEGYLLSKSANSEECLAGIRYAEECGCYSSSTVGSSVGRNETTSDGMSSPSCAFCADGSHPLHPDLDVSDFLLQPAYNMNGTCQTLQNDLLSTLDSDSELCESMQEQFAGVCGCPPRYGEETCIVCPYDDYIPKPDVIVEAADDYDGMVWTCQNVSDWLTQYPKDHELCRLARGGEHICGCNGGRHGAFGTTTKTREVIMIWTPRVTGLLSLLGSSYIVRDYWKSRHARLSLDHASLVFAMSVFDIFSSVAWIMSSAPTPRDRSQGAPVIYGAMGTEATCTMQGFLFQLGNTGSIFFNLILSIYYALVIVWNVRPTRLERFFKYLSVLPVLLAIGMAVAGLEYYTNLTMYCSIPVPPQSTDDFTEALIFVIVPVFTAMSISMCNVISIVVHVWWQSRKADRWRLEREHRRREQVHQQQQQQKTSNRSRDFRINEQSEGNFSITESTTGSGFFRSSSSVNTRRSSSRSIPQKLYWQAFWYLLALLMTWPVYLSFYWVVYRANNSIEGFKEPRMYYYYLSLVIFNPLLGFWNFFIYARQTALWDNVKRGLQHCRSLLLLSSPQPKPSEEDDAGGVVCSGGGNSVEIVAFDGGPSPSSHQSTTDVPISAENISSNSVISA